MARKDRRPPEGRALGALLDRGDHRGAAAEARRILGDPGAGPEERAAAGAALERVRPEPWAVAAGLGGLVLFALVAFLGLRH